MVSRHQTNQALCYLFLIGSIFYIPASILLYFNTVPYFNWSTGIFILASCLFLFGSLLDLYQKYLYWDTASTLSGFIVFAYVIGSFAYVVGSILYIPSLDTLIPGFWIFLVGSICYFIGSIVILINLPSWRLRTVVAVSSYALGSCLFIAGGVVSYRKLPSFIYGTLWLLGSLSYTFGSLIALLNYGTYSNICDICDLPGDEHLVQTGSASKEQSVKLLSETTE